MGSEESHSLSRILKTCCSQDPGGIFEGEVVARFTLSQQGSVNCSAGKGLSLHTREVLLTRGGSKDSQLAPPCAAGWVSWGIPQIMLSFPAGVRAQLCCPDLKKLTGNSGNPGFIPSALLCSCTEGRSWLVLVLFWLCLSCA